MSNVEICLKKSINGESTAVKMYTEFGKLAKEEGFPNIAIMFVALAEAEKIHIKNHKSALGDNSYQAELESYTVGTTLENLKAAYEGEREECKNMYPSFFKAIKKEMNTDYGKVAHLSMMWSSNVEKCHMKLVKKAISYVTKGHDFPPSKFYLCKVCGNIEIKEQEKPCTICGHDAIFFNLISAGGTI